MKAQFRSLEGRRILLVDDSPQILGLLEDIFGACGARTYSAPSGTLAAAMLESRRFDLLILDMHMPGMDGLGVVEHLRLRHPELLRRTLLLTGRRWDASDLRPLGALGVPVCHKPFQIDVLRQHACDLLHRRPVASVA